MEDTSLPPTDDLVHCDPLCWHHGVLELETKVHKVFTITKKALTRTVSWLEAATTKALVGAFSIIVKLLTSQFAKVRLQL